LHKRGVEYADFNSPYQTNVLLGGFDTKADEASLYYIDYLASLNKVNFGCHGYASNFILSIMDREYKVGLSKAEGMAIMEKCVAELRLRFLVAYPCFKIKIVTMEGIEIVDYTKATKA